MKIVARRKSDQNEAVLDPWTLVHFAVGLSAGLVNIGFWKSIAAAMAYELVEHGFERTTPGKNIFMISGPESIPNVVADLGVFGLGHWLGRRWNASGEPRSQ